MGFRPVPCAVASEVSAESLSQHLHSTTETRVQGLGNLRFRWIAQIRRMPSTRGLGRSPIINKDLCNPSPCGRGSGVLQCCAERDDGHPDDAARGLGRSPITDHRKAIPSPSATYRSKSADGAARPQTSFPEGNRKRRARCPPLSTFTRQTNSARNG